MSESRAIAAFAGLGVLLVGVAVAVTRVRPAAVGPGTGTEAPPLASAPAISGSAAAIPAGVAGFPGEIPEKFEPTHDGWDYVRRDAEIPMRDGVKLHTVIVVPKGAKGAPILLTRTPYNADRFVASADSAHLEVASAADVPVEALIDHGYIRVVQDVRGKYGSEGDYVMNRPVRGSQNPTDVDHVTDTYDTIDWLVKNTPESNGKVGILGTSYDGFTSAIVLFEPHPALKVAVPINPMIDGWRGDDWFHNGAFRQEFNLSYIQNQQATRKSTAKWETSDYDDFDTYLRAGSAGELGHRRGLEQLGFWNKIVSHPSYDAFWRDQAVDRVLSTRPLKVPVMIVHSLWDQEDIYGAPALYRALEPRDVHQDKVFLAMGPWRHGGWGADGSSLGAIPFDSDTALTFRRDVLMPFLDQYLKDGAPKADVAPVTAFETGTNQWRRLPGWPSATAATRLYLQADGHAGFTAPASAGYDEYVSDPAKPVPYIPRPVISNGSPEGRRQWREWLVTDQRNVATRPDVLVFTTDVLTAPVKVGGEPLANLIASTSGTDSDWVVKLIDVYPPEVHAHPELGGYQLAVAMDIFRGRYRESLETPRPIAPGEPLLYRFALPDVNHVFLPGHRIMVQVQSTWFPLYDRNPQTFVESIFSAKPGDYRKATQRIHHSPDQASFVELPIVGGG
jgi:putative CocE/NonD family hydrolase